MTQEFIPFTQLGLSEPLLQALHDLQFEKPSPIQEQTIPRLLEGRDLIGLAQTGTGKTAAFSLPILQRLQLTDTSTQALIIAPTRELAIQVAEHIKTLSSHLPKVSITVLCGGQDYRPQLKQLRDGSAVVVGTPGRILDHLDRGTLKLDCLRTLVLDEADEMLRMGFIEDVETILSKLPSKKQIALFSATMPSRIRQIAKQYLTDPVSVEIRMETATVKSIHQRFLFASPAQKSAALLRVLAAEDSQGTIVFVRTKNSADEVAALLQQHGHSANAIHGDLTQALRERVIGQFKQGSVDILVATDVAARGLDVDRVTHVINYDMAHDCETYVHRIGRTGRAGRAGTTILFVSPRESRMLNVIERHTRQAIEKMQIPDDETIQLVMQQRFIDKIKSRLGSKHLAAYRDVLAHFSKEQDVSALDVAAALALMVNQDKSWLAQLALPQVSRVEKEAGGFRRREDKRTDKRGNTSFSSGKKRRAFAEEGPQAIFRLDVGRIHGVKPGNIVGAIANEAGLQSRHITGLKIHDNYSTVRLPKAIPKEVVSHLNKAWVCGRQLNLTLMNNL